MMLRPHDCHDQRTVEAQLQISPKPESLSFREDEYGNQIGIARFKVWAQELRFESVVRLEHTPKDLESLQPGDPMATYPSAYHADELPKLLPFINRHAPDPDNKLGAWVRDVLPAGQAIGPVALLARLSQGIKQGFTYRRREAKGVQRPLETLRLGHGSCRDFAVLMMDAARSLGFAARFVSGYLVIPHDDRQEHASPTAHGATHAWAQIYLSGHGWIDFDPTSGCIGKKNLVTVAVVRDPDDALPLHGTYFGSASDHLAMEVVVNVTSEISDRPISFAGHA